MCDSPYILNVCPFERSVHKRRLCPIHLLLLQPHMMAGCLLSSRTFTAHSRRVDDQIDVQRAPRSFADHCFLFVTGFFAALSRQEALMEGDVHVESWRGMGGVFGSVITFTGQSAKGSARTFCLTNLRADIRFHFFA